MRDGAATTPVTDTEAVATALRRLAARSTPERPAPRSVVADAEAAFRDVETAAAFLEGGETRLRTAVDAARRDGDVAVADRGRSLLESLEHYRRAATPTHPHRTESRTEMSGRSDPLQFRRARTTLLGGDGLRGDR